jgi:hypothetical protein
MEVPMRTKTVYFDSITEKEIEQRAAKAGYDVESSEFGPYLPGGFHWYKGSAKYITGAWEVLTSTELRSIAYHMDQAEKEFRKKVRI